MIAGLRAKIPPDPKVDIAVCPPFTLLHPLAADLAGAPIALGAQNCYCEPEGAFTGEVAPLMLRDAGCAYVIIGHSERRQHFGETGDLLHRKTRAALEAGLAVIYCVGETLDEREAGRTEAVVERQLAEVLADDITVERLTIAYEPVWAIGTGKTATPEQAQQVHAFIRRWVARGFDPGVAEDIRILYGGSVKPDNMASLMSMPDIDGALVGGASLRSDSFLGIARHAAERGC